MTPPSDAPPATLASFGDGAWLFVVDREWSRSLGDAQLPSDPLPDAAYVPVTSGATLPVVVSDAGARVTIGSESPLVGSRVNESEAAVTYDLAESTFAGGRFVVWPQGQGLQAEVTIYGSGLPIVQSRRGALVCE